MLFCHKLRHLPCGFSMLCVSAACGLAVFSGICDDVPVLRLSARHLRGDKLSYIFRTAFGRGCWCLCFICAHRLLGACLFSRLDEKYRIALPLFVSLSFLFAAETACVVLFANETLKWELFLIPALNVIISLILLLILLKVYSGMEIFKYRIKYLEINDQEFELLVNIKEKDKNAYYRAVHAAYFSERIAQALSLDADAAKTAAYYANAGILYKEPEKDLEDAFVSYGFPPYARQLLRELTGKNTGIRHKEAAVVYMADAVISSILYLFEKKQDTKTDYAAVIETVFQKKWESGSLKNSELTFAEWNRMKKIFKEEKLYYDFLR